MSEENLHAALEHILHQPRSGLACRTCSKRLGLYLVRGEHHSLCAPCARDRIESITPEPATRPAWVETLYDEVLVQIRYKERQERERHSVSWDLLKCAACDRMIQRRDARYRTPRPEPSEDEPEKILAPAQQLRDGTVIVFPLDDIPQVYPPVCTECHAAG